MRYIKILARIIGNLAQKKIIQLLVFFFIFCAFSFYLYTNIDKYLHIFIISKSGVILLFFLSSVFPFINGAQNTLLYRGIGLPDFSYKDGYLITSASTLANQLPLPGGIISKGYYLKSIHNFSYTKFTSSTIATFICFLAVSGIMGLLILLFWKFAYKEDVPILLYILFIGLVTPLFLFWIPVNKIKLPVYFKGWAVKAIDGWITIGKNPILIIQLSLIQALLLILLALRYFIVFHMLSQNTTFGQSLLFSSASILTQLVSVAPGGLGVREAIVSSLASVLGFDIGISFLCVGIDRLINTLIIFINGWICISILGKETKFL